MLRNPRGQKQFSLMGRAVAKDAEHHIYKYIIRLISVILIGVNGIVLARELFCGRHVRPTSAQALDEPTCKGADSYGFMGPINI